MADFVPRKPDYSIAAFNKTTQQKGNVGAAWKKPDGSITLKFNPYVVLNFNDEDLIVTLFPFTENPTRAVRKKTEYPEGFDPPPYDEKDIPF